ncbi:MAG: hypothetical protein AABX51_02910 [Nanoarchaeota archaeon]
MQCEQECATESEQNWAELDIMFFAAKKAKIELLKEKMKQHWQAKEGQKLDKAAELVVDALIAHKQNNLETSEKWQELKDKFDQLWN